MHVSNGKCILKLFDRTWMLTPTCVLHFDKCHLKSKQNWKCTTDKSWCVKVQWIVLVIVLVERYLQQSSLLMVLIVISHRNWVTVLLVYGQQSPALQKLPQSVWQALTPLIFLKSALLRKDEALQCKILFTYLSVTSYGNIWCNFWC